MAAIYYKRLFEVRILLEYYLRDNIHQDVFAPANPALESLLAQRVDHQQYNIWHVLTIVPLQTTGSLFEGRAIRLIPTPAGFFVGLKVTPRDNKFVPFISLDPDIRFHFAITAKNPLLRNITNYPLRSSVPAIYYFSNSNEAGNQRFPFLSLPVAPFKAGKTYAMGELAVVGGNLKEALVRTASATASRWRALDAEGLANEGDRILLPKQFEYIFDPESNVSTADIALTTADGTIIKQMSFSSSSGLNRLSLDFNMNNSGEISDGLYQLAVTGDGGYLEERKVYLSNSLYRAGSFGLIDIKPGEADFRLLEADGSLRTPVPVFEIRLKSRSTYWRYISSKGKKLKVTDKTDPYLTVTGGALQASVPRPLTFMPVEFRRNDPAIERVFLPNPPTVSFKPEADGRVYSDIYLDPIKGLIEEDV